MCQLDVFQLVGYSTGLKFEYPPRSELLSTPASHYSRRRLSKVEWSINDQQVVECLRATFTDGEKYFTSPLFTHPVKSNARVNSCVTIPFIETIRSVNITADAQQVYQVSFRSDLLEYPAFL